MNNTVLLWALHHIQVFLATTDCNEYLDDIIKEDRTITLNTLLQLEYNIIRKGDEKNEKI